MARAKKQAIVPPQGTIRRSQVVTSYGPGSMIDLVHQAALVGGLDFWSYDPKSGTPIITESRLRDSLAKRFKAAGRELSVEKAFKEPPIGDDREPGRHSGVQVLEFPQWFVCQNPRCRALMHKVRFELKKDRYWHRCGEKNKAHECVPVRFLGACRRGHCQEWPWVAFAHLNKKSGRCGSPELRFSEGTSGDFSELAIKCACGARQKLALAMTKRSDGRMLFDCEGERPWLGAEGKEECEESLRLLVRTASNSYFSQVVSALSVPEPGMALANAIAEEWSVLQAVDAKNIQAFRTIPSVSKALEDWSDAEVLAAVEAKKSGAATERDPLRTAEFKQFVASEDERPGDRPAADCLFYARRYRPEGGLATGIEKLVIAQKLREVRAQIGFTRLEPATPDLQGEFDLQVQSAPLGLTTDWLPATEVLGEGVFIELSEEAIQEWSSRPAVKERSEELHRGYEQWLATLSSAGRDKAPPFLGERFYLLHSLSHLLISAISLECGYSASAIRERIYCQAATQGASTQGRSTGDPKTPMAAILLSTGSSGSEGTLGGLVEQGRKIGEHLRRAWDLGRLCANDPVCAGHSPADDPAERYLEGAGCHGCLFIAETSCERFNRFLDRALVVPTVGRAPELAFFRERP